MTDHERAIIHRVGRILLNKASNDPEDWRVHMETDNGRSCPMRELRRVMFPSDQGVFKEVTWIGEFSLSDGETLIRACFQELTSGIRRSALIGFAPRALGRAFVYRAWLEGRFYALGENGLECSNVRVGFSPPGESRPYNWLNLTSFEGY